MGKKIDMINGKLSKNIILFIIPVILTGILQYLFTACDMIVVGKFAGDKALAAVGATASLCSLIINGFVGIAVGVNVVTAQLFGMKNEERVERAVHTSVLLGIICGVALTVIGIIITEPCLKMINTPEDIIDLSGIYMKIYFLGMPAMLVYNFGASILRAYGDTKTPLIYLTIGGVVNVILNLILVIVFKLSVEGVAIATFASQLISCILVIRYLVKFNGLKLKKLKIDKKIAKNIFAIGIPAGLNSMVFSFANMQIQSNVNSFGSSAVAGCAAAGNIETFTYIAMNAVPQAATSFTGQNVGANRFDNIPKIIKWCFLYVIIIGIILSSNSLIFGKELLSLYVSSPASIDAGLIRLKTLMPLYALCGCMELLPGVMRGMGYSLAPTIISLVGACGLRLLWIATVFKIYPSLMVLYVSLPVSWVVTIIANFIAYKMIIKKEKLF